jgi:hypothetical protein
VRGKECNTYKEFYGISPPKIYILGYNSEIKSRKMRWAGHVTRMEERRDAFRILVRKPEKKETTGKTKA